MDHIHHSDSENLMLNVNYIMLSLVDLFSWLIFLSEVQPEVDRDKMTELFNHVDEL